MRPVKLTMKAFGSYAEETIVDFDQIGKDIYLITGDTGAGKTTIFDAIVFALYGESSGQNRDASRMHSDYVGKDVAMEVHLTFEHQGKLHEVERTARYSKKRGTKEYNEKPIVSAQLWEADKPVIDVPKKVTDRVEEMIGLDVKQFSKIVMLAQGEFRRFLDSKDDERAAILKSLFDFSEYSRYQGWIKDTFEKLDKSRASSTAKRGVIMEGFTLPEGTTEEEKALYDSGHPFLMQNLENLLEQDKHLYEQAVSEKNEAQAAFSEAEKTLENASAHNKKLIDLSNAKKKKEALAAEAEAVKALGEQVARAEKALRQVKGVENTLLEKKRILFELKKSIAALEEKKLQLTEDKKMKLSLSAKAHESDQRIRDLEHEIKLIEDSLPKYKELAELTASLESKKAAHKKAEAVFSSLKTKIDADDQRIRQVETELEKLGNAEAEMVAAENLLKNVKGTYDRLTGANGILAGIRKIRAGESELSEMTEEYKAQLKAVTAAKEVYDRLYAAFISNQAGALAVHLQQEIEKKGQGLCPVCGTHFAEMPAHGFAEISGDACTEAQVKKAKTAFDQAEKKRAGLSDKKTTLEQKVIADREAQLIQARELFAEEELSWETLTDTGYLSGKKTECKAAVDQAGAVLKAAAEKVTAKENLAAEKKKKSETLEKNRGTAAELEPKVTQLAKEIAAQESSISEKKKALTFADASAANLEMKKRFDEKKRLEGAIEKADEVLKSAEKVLDETTGKLEGEKGKMPKAEAEENESAGMFTEAIRKNGFADEDDYRTALPDGGEAWIKVRNTKIQEYTQAVHDNNGDIERLTKETEGWVFAETDELKEQLNTQKEVLDRADQKVQALHYMKSSHENTYQQLCAIQKELAGTEIAYQRLSSLNRLAGGSTESGGKLSFERFAMGSSFREILEAANVRLLVMSNGRYELRHTTSAATARSQAGLGIQVYDNATGKQREANSISGGESFQVSLSLALGLSDVVQSHAGGNRIDAMFIDEGFGSLSDEALAQAVKVLENLSGREKQIGLISHVGSLRESIGKKIIVSSDKKKGSSLRIEI